MNEKNRIRAFAFVAAGCAVAAVCSLVAAALGSNTAMWITLACANVGCAGTFGLVAVGKAKRIRGEPEAEK